MKRRATSTLASKKALGPKTKRKKSQASKVPASLSQTGIEKKVLLTSQGTAGSSVLAMNATGTILALNLIQAGSSMFNRIGRRIEMKSIRFQATVNVLNVTRSSLIDYCRLLVVYDRQTNGALPTINTVLLDTDQAANNTTTSFSGINMNNRERFFVLMDKRFAVPAVTNTASVLTNVFPNGDSQWPKTDEFRKIPGLTTHYGADSAPAVIGDITTGGLYVICLATIAAGAENFQVATWNARLKYIDV